MKNGQEKRLRKKLAKIDDAISRANRRFLTAGDLTDELDSDFRQLVETYRTERLEVEVGIHLPLCSEHILRAFLKKLGAKVYVHWRPRALKDKRGNIRIDEDGQIVRGTRNFELDHARITAEFRPEDVVSCGSSSCNRVHSHDTD